MYFLTGSHKEKVGRYRLYSPDKGPSISLNYRVGGAIADHQVTANVSVYNSHIGNSRRNIIVVELPNTPTDAIEVFKKVIATISAKELVDVSDFSNVDDLVATDLEGEESTDESTEESEAETEAETETEA